MDFSHLIIEWYKKNSRDLPWRRTADPYRIWVSEVILQQTRVRQGLSYYERFLENFPDIESLAMAQEEEVMKTWQGLGYYTRARNMHQSAKDVVENYSSRFPVSYDELIKLKGIGDYSASAISSIVNHEPHPVVDGNVLRVVARYKGINVPVNTLSGKKVVKEFLIRNIDKDDPGTFNQALMELGALVCKPKQPLCTECPLNHICYAINHNSPGAYPILEKSKVVRTRYFQYLVVISQKQGMPSTWIKKRTGKDIWENLYDFPLIETGQETSIMELEKSEGWRSIFYGFDISIDGGMESRRHLLSHQELKVNFIRVRVPEFHHNEYLEVPLTDIHKYPVPRLIENYLKKIGW